MNDAIRAQRERRNVPTSMLPPDDEPAPIPAAAEPMSPQSEPEPAPKHGFLARLLGR